MDDVGGGGDAIGAAFDDLVKDVLHLDVRVDVHPLRRQLPLGAGV